MSPVPRMKFIVLVFLVIIGRVSTFSRLSMMAAFRRSQELFSSVDGDEEVSAAESTIIDEEDPLLSDLDARVLQTMLQDEDKLDLNTAESMRKLLERGVAPKEAPTSEPAPFEYEEEESEFSSQALKTLADTKLWRSLRAKADEILESVQIYVANRIERDAKLLVSVGAFAFERARSDFDRALPAVSQSFQSTVKPYLQLTNVSSFAEMQERIQIEEQQQRKSLEDVKDVRQELNTPLDEIKSVTATIRDILSGESVDGVSSASSSRGLRTVAPAGQSKIGERQRRAYQRRKETTLREEKQGPIGAATDAAGSFVNTAWEVRRELQGERSRPGYRTENIRNLLEAGADTTSKFLAAARAGDRDAWRKILFPPTEEVENQVKILDSSAEVIRESSPILDGFIKAMTEEDEPEFVVVDTSAFDAILDLELPDVVEYVADPIPFPTELFAEQANVAERLKLCITQPDSTWLTPDVLTSLDGDINEDALRDVVTAMICARDDFESSQFPSADEFENMDDVVAKLAPVKAQIENICALASECAGISAATELRSILYGVTEEDDDALLILLDEVKADWEADVAKAAQDALLKTEESKATRKAAEQAKVDAQAAKEETLAEAERRNEEIRQAREEAAAAAVAKEEEEEARRLEEERQLEARRLERERILKEQEDAQVEAKSTAGAFFVEAVEMDDADGVVEETVVDTETVSSVVDVEVMDANVMERSVSSPAVSPMQAVDFQDVLVSDVTVSNESTPVTVVTSDNNNDDDDSLVSMSVEVVSDDEMEESELTEPTKVAEAAGEEEDESRKAEDDVLVLLTLRSLDIIFLILEKVFVVGIPSVLNAGGIASKRIAQVNKGGLGSEGWDKLENAKTGDKRY